MGKAAQGKGRYNNPDSGPSMGGASQQQMLPSAPGSKSVGKTVSNPLGKGYPKPAKKQR